MKVEPFYRFMVERESVRLFKEAGAPWPWTNDEILKEYKFTNVKRTHDRTSLGFKQIYDQNSHQNVDSQLLNCGIHRYFGTLEFAEALGWQETFDPKSIKDLAKQRLSQKQRVFTGAYVITNQGIRAPKEDVVVDIFLAGLWAARDMLISIARLDRRWQTFIEEMKKINGFGGTGFMAKEVTLDTLMTGIWPEQPKDLNTWCPAGPGALRGISRLLGHDNPYLHKVSQKDALVAMKDIFAMRATYWPEDYVELELHDIQFQLCEFDKYERVRLGQGRPRSRYRKP